MLNLFDILGPVMVGPSSSHTAGAVRIGLMARTLLGGKPAEASILLHGSFAETGLGHGTDRALIAGLLGMRPDDLRIPDAFEEAKKAKLKFTIGTVHLRDAHPNTAVIHVTSTTGNKLALEACSLGGGRIMVTKLGGIEVNFTGMYNTLVAHHRDYHGVVAGLTNILSQLQFNVASMSVSRHKRGGDMLTVIEIDQHLKPNQVQFLSELPGILTMAYYDKEEEDDVTGFDEGDL